MSKPKQRLAVGALLRWAAGALRLIEGTLSPLGDLLVRAWLAQIYFVSAVIKLASWDSALALARYEYPVAWLDPVAAAQLGVGVELAGSILLAVGLGTRFGALALLLLTLVMQIEYRALDAHLLQAMLLGWYVFRGAGGLSIDRAVARGLADSAIPWTGPALAALERVSRRGFPAYLAAARAGIAAAAWLAWTGNPRFAAMLPSTSAAAFTGPTTMALLALLAAGFAARPAALALALATLAMLVGDMDATPGLHWLAVFVLLVLDGPGHFALDTPIAGRLRRSHPELEGKPAFSLDGLPHVVIVGAGFGGLACAMRLARTPVRVTLIDRHNYHLFQPLLYQVATTALSPADIAMPIRGHFRDQFNARVVLGTVSGVDTARREVVLADRRLGYDYLVLATGASHSYFGRDEWAEVAPGLKGIEDATEIRRRILTAFERAELTDDATERASLLTFLIVGGGPTGVELAGAIAELARFGMDKDFRNFDPGTTRIVLLQSAPRVLPTFAEALSAATERSLRRLGVEVITGSKVEQIDADGVVVSGQRIAARTVLWAAGVVASPAASWLGAPRDAAGRLKVEADLSVPGDPSVFAIGDTASVDAWEGRTVPGLAPAAKQAGRFVADVIAARVAGRAPPSRFRYRHPGSLATIGRSAAVVDFGTLRVTGALAWWLWGAIHVGFLVGVRNRVSVLLDWFWAYLTFRGGTRLILGPAVLAPASGVDAPSGTSAADRAAMSLPARQRTISLPAPQRTISLPAPQRTISPRPSSITSPPTQFTPAESTSSNSRQCLPTMSP